MTSRSRKPTHVTATPQGERAYGPIIIERRETVGVVKPDDDDAGEFGMLQAAFLIVSEAMSSALEDTGACHYEFVYGLHKFDFTAESTIPDAPIGDSWDDPVGE